MKGWNWLADTAYNWRFVLRLVVKAAVLFAVINLVFAGLGPLPWLGKLSGYNILWAGRERLPYGENPAVSYNLSLDDLNAMFASHELSAGRDKDAFRVFLMGDSSVWGFLLKTDETLAAYLNAGDYDGPDGRRLQVYNVGYPTMSATKDLLLVDYVMRYEPDLVVWLVTLESLPRDKQLRSPILQNNPSAARDLIARYDLALDNAGFVEPDFWGRTLVGQRRALSDWLRLQLYGPVWASTRIDQAIPETYTPRQSDFEEDISWQTLDSPAPLDQEHVGWDVLMAGASRVGETPFLLVNEPIFISEGENSDLRYNFWYPRWAYDDYRERLADLAESQGWAYVDLWDSLPPDEFTDSPVHLTPAGSAQLSQLIAAAILELLQP